MEQNDSTRFIFLSSHVFVLPRLGSPSTRVRKRRGDEKQASRMGNRCLRAIGANTPSRKVRTTYPGGRGLLPGVKGGG